MPRLDAYHHVVKNALIRDGWTITDDPLMIEYKGLRLFADLGAEKSLGAEKDGRRIAVEIKVFSSVSPVTELQKALGQYDMYRILLQRVPPQRELFLAIARDVYDDFFQRPAIQEIIAELQTRLLVFDVQTEEVVLWIN